MEIRAQVAETCREYGMFPEEGMSVVLAVSGGPDSLALLHLLAAMNGRELPGFTGHVAHLHHGLRGQEADEDAEFVRFTSRALGMECHTERVDVPRLARVLSVGIEEAGRRARYAFFRKVAERVGALRVATGHHADDNVETVLMRVARGMTFRALSGIPPMRPIGRGSPIQVVRPLIDCRRAAIEAYLRERRLTPRIDSTNETLDNLRNRIRHKVLPRFEGRMVPGVTDSILKSIRAFRRSRRGLALQASELIRSGPVRETEREIRAPVRWLRALSDILRGEVIHQLLLRCVPTVDDLTIGHHEAVLRLLGSDKTTGESSLPGGVVARREYDDFVLTSGGAPPRPPATSVPLKNGETPLPQFNGSLTVRLREDGAKSLAAFLERRTPEMALLDADRLKGRLAVRAWRPGDRMTPLGAPGEKKLQDIFTDRKVPRTRRRRTPVLTLDDNPVWIVGHVIDDAVRVRDETANAVEFVFRRDDEG